METTIISVVDNNKRTKCEIYARVMGYFSPFSNYNIWKKSEFKERVCYDENKSLNSKFLKEYWIEQKEELKISDFVLEEFPLISL